MKKVFEVPLYAYARSPDQDAGAPARHPVVVVGAGPVGLAAAIDLASRVGSRERSELLALRLSGRRWEWFRAAYTDAEKQPFIPDEPAFALARARLAQGGAQDDILAAHLADSCANPDARRAYAQFLLGETLFQRNTFLQNVVKGAD